MVNGNGRARTARPGIRASCRSRAAFLQLPARSGIACHAAALGVSRGSFYRAHVCQKDCATGRDAALARSRKQIRAHREAWSAATRRRFLTVLAASGSPAHAATAVGRTLASANRFRGRAAGFARDWTAAQERALDQLEVALTEQALGGVRRIFRRGTEAMAPIEFLDQVTVALSETRGDARCNCGWLPPATVPEVQFSRHDLISCCRCLGCCTAPKANDLAAAAGSATVSMARRADR